jgi:hypothetical protein
MIFLSIGYFLELIIDWDYFFVPADDLDLDTDQWGQGQVSCHVCIDQVKIDD